MAERGPLSLWARRALFLAVAGVLVLAGLVPMGTAPRAVPPPEALLTLTLAWVARRPAEVPAPSVALVFVLADLLLMRPPGLHALLVVAGVEWLRAHPARAGEPLAEWGRAGGVILALVLAEQAALALTLSGALAGGPEPGAALLRAALTAVVYPLAVLIAGVAFGVRRPRPRPRARSGGGRRAGSGRAVA